MNKLHKFLFIAIFTFIVIPIFRVESVSAYISYDSSINFMTSAPSIIDWDYAYPRTNVSGTYYVDNLTGANDNVVATSSFFTTDAQRLYATSDKFSDIVLPTGAVIDTVIYTLYASSTDATGSFSCYIGDTSAGAFGKTETMTPAINSNDIVHAYNCVVSSSMNQGGFNYDSDIATLSHLNSDTTVYFVAPSATPRIYGYDALSLTVFYHYDTVIAGVDSSISNFFFTGSLSGTPIQVSTTTSLSTVYKYYSTDDTATSTKYTSIVYRVEDLVTNSVNYVFTPILTKDAWATSTISNFCNGGLINCVATHTYLIKVALANDDLTVSSGYFTTQYWFIYNGNFPPTTWATTTNPYIPPYSATSTWLIYNGTSTSFGSAVTDAIWTDFVDRCANIQTLLFFNVPCLVSIIVPGATSTGLLITQWRNNVIGRLPFVGALFTTATGTVPVISATIPTGIVGAGQTITLDINHSIDWLLNATSSFSTSTATLYQRTIGYWQIALYLLFVLYVLSRVFSHDLFGSYGSVGGAVIYDKRGRQRENARNRSDIRRAVYSDSLKHK
jgi:hypothetical protein